jgi:hypothetical protein
VVAPVDEEIEAASATASSSTDNWWIWLIVGVSIVFVLCFLALVCGVAAYMRYQPAPVNEARVKLKNAQAPGAGKKTAAAAAARGGGQTKNQAALGRARQAKGQAPAKKAPATTVAVKSTPRSRAAMRR